MKNQKGITLIALVVTIIVLIILAGISINLLFGNNGIISKTQEAREKYLEGANEESLALSNVESFIDKYFEGIGIDSKNSSVNNSITGPLGTAINANNYGKKVTNYTAADLVWRLLYEDSNNYYLISETADGDFPIKNAMVCNYATEDNGHVKIYTPKDESYVSGASISRQGQDLMPLASGTVASNGQGTNPNGYNFFTSEKVSASIYATAYLCDISKWETYKTGSAAWAMGGPTTELYAASYNATHAEKHVVFNMNENGYNRVSASDGFAYFQTNENNGIYALNNGVWWIAGPDSSPASSLGDQFGITICDSYQTYGGYIGGYNLCNAHSLRPVVCIPKSSNFTCIFERNVPAATGGLGSAVNAADYGKEVTNYSVTAQPDVRWRLYYEDSNNIYLMGAEKISDGKYIRNAKLVNYDENTGIYTSIDNKYFSGADVSIHGQALMPMISHTFTTSNTNPSILGAAYLTDTDLDGPWAEFRSEPAAWAMGAPTIELFAASYNATHSPNTLRLEARSENFGYTYNTFEFTAGEKHGIYRLSSNIGYAWIVLPNSITNDDIIYMNDRLGKFISDDAYHSNSIRPVVCIPKSTGFTCTFGSN